MLPRFPDYRHPVGAIRPQSYLWMSQCTSNASTCSKLRAHCNDPTHLLHGELFANATARSDAEWHPRARVAGLVLRRARQEPLWSERLLSMSGTRSGAAARPITTRGQGLL